MVHTRILVRQYSATPDPGSLLGMPRIPMPVHRLRVLPFAPQATGQAAGSYPVQLLRPDSGGELLTIADGAVKRFAVPNSDGWALLSAVTPSGVADTWLVEWTDDPRDELGSVPPGVRGVLLWDSGVVAGGAAIQSPVLDLSPYREALVIVANGDTNPRNLTRTDYLDDGVTSLGTSPVLAMPVGTGFAAFGQGASTAGGVLAFAAPLPTRGRFALAAGAAGNGRVTIIGR